MIKLTQWGSLFAGLGVIAGAFGAHGLKSRGTISQEKLSSWQTASHYQILHSMAIIMADRMGCRRAAWCFIGGNILFSGSIYGLILSESGNYLNRILGPLTPLGGLLHILGWTLLALS